MTDRSYEAIIRFTTDQDPTLQKFSNGITSYYKIWATDWEVELVLPANAEIEETFTLLSPGTLVRSRHLHPESAPILKVISGPQYLVEDITTGSAMLLGVTAAEEVKD